MHLFWNHIIKNICELLRPQVLVEIGVAEGLHTKKILTYCQQFHAVLHAIDPHPQCDSAEWETQYGEHFVMHTDMSLNVLDQLPRYDMVLIDGDHNWYTVYHELLMIEKRAQEAGSFPFVFVHDIEWPYARRDMYFDPKTIPDIYLQPHQKKGVVHGEGMLQDNGLNAHCFNALYEHSLRNGVKTAVEDFLQHTTLDLRYKEVPGLHGLGMIMTSQQEQQLAGFLATLHISPTLTEHIHALENDRLIHKQQADDTFLRYKETKQEQHSLLQQLEHERQKTVSFEKMRDATVRLREENVRLKADIAHICHTKSWRLMAPMRFAQKGLGSVFRLFRK